MIIPVHGHRDEVPSPVAMKVNISILDIFGDKPLKDRGLFLAADFGLSD